MMKLKPFLLLISASAVMAWNSSLLHAEPVPVETIRQLTDANARQAIALYREFLSLPNDANYPDVSVVKQMEHS